MAFDVVVGEDVGVDAQVKAPVALTPPEVAKQKYIEVDAPLAVTVPFKVADEAATELAAFVVTVGKPALIVRVRVFDDVVLALSVT